MSIGYQVKYTLIVILKNSECSQTNCYILEDRMKPFNCLDYKNCKYYNEWNQCYPDCSDYEPIKLLECDNCGRIETEPYDIGDACYQICGGTFIEYNQPPELTEEGQRTSDRPEYNERRSSV